PGRRLDAVLGIGRAVATPVAEGFAERLPTLAPPGAVVLVVLAQLPGAPVAVGLVVPPHLLVAPVRVVRLELVVMRVEAVVVRHAELLHRPVLPVEPAVAVGATVVAPGHLPRLAAE